LTLASQFLFSIISQLLPAWESSFFGNPIIRGISIGTLIFVSVRALRLEKAQYFPRSHVERNREFSLGLLIAFALFLASWLVTEIEVLVTVGDGEYLSKSQNVFYLSDRSRFFLTTLIVTPICEEVFYRGIILSSLTKTYGESKANIYSAIAFSIIHVQFHEAFFSSIAFSFLLGLLLGQIFLTTQNIWLTILVHFFWNLMVYLFSLIMIHSGFRIDSIEAFTQLAIIMLAASALCLIGGLSLYKKIAK